MGKRSSSSLLQVLYREALASIFQDSLPYVKLQWNDPRLRWCPDNYTESQVTEPYISVLTHVKSKDIWRPDLFWSRAKAITPPCVDEGEETGWGEEVTRIRYDGGVSTKGGCTKEWRRELWPRRHTSSQPRIRTDGEVFWSKKVVATHSCSMNFDNYPFDKQVCETDLQSYGNSGDILEFKLGLGREREFPLKLDRNKFSELTGPFHLDALWAETVQIYDVMGPWCRSTIILCDNGGCVFQEDGFAVLLIFRVDHFPCAAEMVDGTHVLENALPHFSSWRFLYEDEDSPNPIDANWTDLLTPTVDTLVVLSCVALWIDAEKAPARVAAGVTTVLVMITLMFTLRKELPVSGTTMAMEIYIFVCFTFVAVNMVEYGFINYCNTSINHGQQDVDAKVRNLQLMKDALVARANMQEGDASGLGGTGFAVAAFSALDLSVSVGRPVGQAGNSTSAQAPQRTKKILHMRNANIRHIVRELIQQHGDKKDTPIPLQRIRGLLEALECSKDTIDRVVGGVDPSHREEVSFDRFWKYIRPTLDKSKYELAFRLTMPILFAFTNMVFFGTYAVTSADESHSPPTCGTGASCKHGGPWCRVWPACVVVKGLTGATGLQFARTPGQSKVPNAARQRPIGGTAAPTPMGDPGVRVPTRTAIPWRAWARMPSRRAPSIVPSCVPVLLPVLAVCVPVEDGAAPPPHSACAAEPGDPSWAHRDARGSPRLSTQPNRLRRLIAD
eukprot:gene20774-biopygen77102